MSAVPAFEIGVWNACILTIYQVLAIPYLFYLAGKRGATNDQELDLSTMRRVISGFTKMLVFLLLIYSIFLPLQLGTMWFYVGLPITLLGLVTRAMALVNWATTPPNEPVTRGLYHYSKHPMYITDFLFFVGLGIATASWILLLFSVFWLATGFILANPEELDCLKKYGDSYRQYMSRTPRWIGMPKSQILKERM
jgi:protein-S-isoprenylcysteine O-methyltransferase Ste14